MKFLEVVKVILACSRDQWEEDHFKVFIALID